MAKSFATACAATRIVKGFPSAASMLAVAVLFAASLVSAHHARAQNLVQNPGFEDTLSETGSATTTPGWTTGGGGGTAFSTSQANPDDPGPNSGIWYAEFQSTSANQAGTSTLSQTITTVKNTDYVVTFFLANNGGPHDSFLATFGGQTVLSLTDSEAFGYTRYTATIKATSTSMVLAFTGEQDPSVFGLDDVSVEAGPAPVTGGGIGSIIVVIAGLSLHRMRRKV